MDRRSVQRWRRAVGWAVGVLLIAGAVWAAAGRVDLSQLTDTEPWVIAALAGAVLANLVITAGLFQVVTYSFDTDPPVPGPVMFKLICASGLLNYLPLRAGLVGRAAYLKARHRLPVRQSVLILLVILASGALVLGATGAAVLLAGEQRQWQACAIAIAVMLVITPLTGPIASRLLRRHSVMAWTWLPLRITDMLIGGVKLMLAFRIMGHTIGYEHALALRAIGSLIDMAGVTPNGLGLREWAMTALYPPTLAAAVIERAIEAIVVVIAGLASLARLPRTIGSDA